MVDAALRGADIADAGEEVVKVVGLAGAGRVFEALVVDGKAFDEVFCETGGAPVVELGAAVGADAVADGEDGFEL